MEHVYLNVSGTNFEFRRKLLDGKPVGKMANMCDAATRAGEPLKFFVDRPPEAFGAILSYYQTGELHMSTSVCPGNFLRELEFWEVDSKELSDCCRYRLQTHYAEISARRTFLKEAADVFPVDGGTTSPCSGKPGRCLGRLWKIVDNRESTVVARVYLAVVLFMLLLSIGTLAFSTESSFRRLLSKCEYLEYMAHSEHKLHESVMAVFGDVDCVENTHWFRSGDYDDDEKIDESYFDDWIYDQDDPKKVNKQQNRTTNLTSDAAQRNASQPGGKTSTLSHLPRLTVQVFALDVMEAITVVFFTIDFILRIISCPSRVRYFFSIINVIDVVALLGCYVHIITVAQEREHRYAITWMNFINYLQVFRAMRFLRVFSSVRAGKILVYSLKSNARDFVLIILLLLFGITTFSTLFYFIEDRDNIKSIPEAWYWSIITMTTVGYGDFAPKTGFGKCLASICAICGVMFLAVALHLFVTNFLTLCQYANMDNEIPSPLDGTDKTSECPENQSNGTKGQEKQCQP